MMLRRAVFLDKDDTLVPDVPYAADPERTVLLPGIAQGLRLLHAAGFVLIVVTNQSGIARGLYPESAVVAVGERLGELFNECGVPLTGFYYCPHHPAGTLPTIAIECLCRKPRAGMLLRAADQHGIDLTQSWMMGDKVDDVLAGQAAGCRTMQLFSGSHKGASNGLPSLLAVARKILG